MRLLAIFIAVPLLEIALFIQVGGFIGLWPTLAIVLATAILGSWLVRSQGAAELGRLKASLNNLDDPSEPLVHGAMILFSGALLLTPGFFTDAVGFALLIPGVRRTAFEALRKRINVQSFSYGGTPAGQQPRRPHGDRVIDGEFEEVTPPKNPTHRPSEWTKH
ncbi:FxsA family protein [Roseisalinus antarcticus]|uniref:Phage T7 F exclusion suppressor FxsA n=1 Tax=Roseisalinus antarcticus TaxID=254357 RepID=A0A1Y5S1Z1_9RHOB|nr:FxsA family protein [Roseisalinus antarcticus]SLN30802.1 phage T7 F exclusion suppressor FxsA [Roseisalinus antarcticus]